MKNGKSYAMGRDYPPSQIKLCSGEHYEIDLKSGVLVSGKFIGMIGDMLCFEESPIKTTAITIGNIDSVCKLT